MALESGADGGAAFVVPAIALSSPVHY